MERRKRVKDARNGGWCVKSVLKEKEELRRSHGGLSTLLYLIGGGDLIESQGKKGRPIVARRGGGRYNQD